MCVESFVMSLPLKATVPCTVLSISTTPEIVFMIVVLPAPFEPMMTITSPRRTSKLTPFRAAAAP